MVQRNYVRYYFALIGGRSGLSITKSATMNDCERHNAVISKIII